MEILQCHKNTIVKAYHNYILSLIDLIINYEVECTHFSLENFVNKETNKIEKSLSIKWIDRDIKDKGII